MKFRNQKGINLITLSVAITIMVIITGVLVYTTRDGAKAKNLNYLYNDIELLNNKIAMYYLEHNDIPKAGKYNNVDFYVTMDYYQLNPNNGSDYYVIDLKKLDGITLNYGKDYSELEYTEDVNTLVDLYIINEQSHTIYYPRGIDIETLKYYTIPQEWDEVKLDTIPIYTAEQLAKIGSDEKITIDGIKYTFSINGTYVLKNNINLSSICYKVDGTTANDKSWTPIGRIQANPFTGKFYGNGHEISGLYINTTSNNQGLFGVNSGQIYNLTVSGSITTTSTNVGGIAGLNNGSIYGCTSNVKIK